MFSYVLLYDFQTYCIHVPFIYRVNNFKLGNSLPLHLQFCDISGMDQYAHAGACPQAVQALQVVQAQAERRAMNSTWQEQDDDWPSTSEGRTL